MDKGHTRVKSLYERVMFRWCTKTPTLKSTKVKFVFYGPYQVQENPPCLPRQSMVVNKIARGPLSCKRR